MFGKGRTGSKLSMLLMNLTLVLIAFYPVNTLPTAGSMHREPKVSALPSPAVDSLAYIQSKPTLPSESSSASRGAHPTQAVEQLPVAGATIGNTANLNAGISIEAQTPAALPILPGNTWWYFKGTVAPPAGWNTAAFDDTAWLSGPTGIGYGDGDDATVLGDMQNSYLTIYTRKVFNLPDASAISNLKLTLNYDDGFVAYLNGVEVARSNVAGSPPAFDAVATAGHEAGTPEIFNLGPQTGVLVSGTNVLAVEIHNSSLGSTDLTFIPTLEATNPAPDAPVNVSPANGATGVSANPNLCATVTDPQSESLSVTFYGRPINGTASQDFTVIALPDTQFYARDYPATFNAQTQWIVNNKASRNIVFVTQLGDCTNDGDTLPYEWTNADTAFDFLEDPGTTGLTFGIPYGIAVGNHDQTPIGNAGTPADPGATTSYFNQTFGVSRYAGRPYYAGHWGSNNDNHYELFSASGMDFIIIHLEYDTVASQMRTDVLNWAHGLLQTYSGRRAIITSHYILNPNTTFSNQGQAIYDALKDMPNLFLMLSGHLDTAARRADVFNGQTVYSLMSDYQTQPNGGNGWLRILTFSPDNDEIRIQTYSPTLSQFWTTDPNQFTLAYDMPGGTPFETIGTLTGVTSGSTVCMPWPSRAPSSNYQWYASASDSTSTTNGPRWTFTSGGNCTVPEDCDDADPCTTDSCDAFTCSHAPMANCCVDDSGCDDGNLCTDDSCDIPVPGGTGTCLSTNNTLPCVDDNPCTTGDVCSGGTCSGTPLNCNDGNSCTADSCSNGVCENLYTGAPGCCATAAECDDGISCTTDTCEASGSCLNTPGPLCCTQDTGCDDLNLCTANQCITGNSAALSFNGSTDFVSMGAAPGLNAATFTVEFWMKRTGTGTTANTGTGGFDGIPLITKGVGESEASNVDMNYFVGISDSAGGVIGADFEEGAGGASPSLNHPAFAASSINLNTWYHVAVTYDGTEWKIYLNGVLDGNVVVGQPPASATTQRFGLGAAINSTGTATGRFQGLLDEVRVWDYARPDTEIQADMYRQVLADPNPDPANHLLGRWGLNEGSGTVVNDSTTPAENSTVFGATWETNQADLLDLGLGTCSYPPVASCCLTGADCDDQVGCTTDTCVSNACQHTPTPGCCLTAADCTQGDACHPASCESNSCVYGQLPNCCVTNGDCGDSNACTSDVCSTNSSALLFDGVDDRVVMGAAPGLNASPAFTLETWFNWNGGGVSTGTGGGGITNVIPLVAKGGAQDETAANNMNYLLGLKDGRLVADFEEAAGANTGLNHPVCTAVSQPAISTNAWHHAAAVYDGTCWQIYLDGQLLPIDTACSACAGAACNVCPGAAPEPNSIQHFALATSLNSSGAPATAAGPAGFFGGRLDEVRVWKAARSQADIQASMNRQVVSDPGGDLIGHWSLNENSGTTSGDSTSPSENGTLTGPNGLPTWAPGNPGLTGSCANPPIPGCCLTNSDCADADLCTVDTCSGNVCSHTATPGCCLTAADCNDGNVCTSDSCVANSCVNSGIAGCCNSDGQCGDSLGCTQDLCPAAGNVSALSFDGTNDYVTMGAAPGLNVSPAFTVETWFYWTGAGTTTSTGTEGVPTAIPLVGKGAAQAETPANLNMNYFLGLSGGKLAADFEEATGANTGLNHAACGTTTVSTNSWHHAAAVYNGACWQLYLDGRPEAMNTACSSCTGANCNLCPGATPEPGSVQHFGLGTTLTSAGAAAGFFAGRMDEVRVWNVARSQAQIQDAMNRQTVADPGGNLKGHWSLNENQLLAAGDSSGTGASGTLTNGPAWVAPPGATLPSFGVANTCFNPLSPAQGCCADNSACADTDPCTSAEVCNLPTFTCTATVAPNCCDANADCNDSNTCTADACSPSDSGAISFNGTSQYISYGVAATHTKLALTRFTVEAWIKWGGTGATTSTGTLTAAIPIVTKGRGQADTPANLNLNYFMGLSGGKLAADFEDTGGGANHAVTGATTVTQTVWHHVAATYDGTAVRVFLDGVQDGTVATTATPETTSIQPFGVATAFDSNGVAAGFFGGQIDEVRVWSRALPQSEIQANLYEALTSGTGLVGRWGMNEASGTAVLDSTSSPVSGTLVASPTRVTGSLVVGHCIFTPVANGTGCSDDSACTQTDSCQAGVCAGSSPVTCATPDQCHDAGVCNPATGLCSNPPKANGTPCNDGNPGTSGDVCTNGVCAGADLCSSVTCTALDQCHNAGVCNPATGICSNPVKADGASCDDGSACTQTDTCQAGVCAGTAVTCDDANPCTVDTCNPAVSGGCVYTPGNAGSVCRASAGTCDFAEVCDGTAGTCPADTLVAGGTECHASAGPCDLAEVCTGTAPACPVDALQPAGTVCGAADGLCDPVDTCDGASVTCTDTIAAAGTECRAAAGSCDVAEVCNGTAGTCPADTLVAGGTECRASAGPCDLAEVCTGTAPACPVDAVLPVGTVCGAADGSCDPADTCDGASVTCTDTIAAAGTECRAAAGSCDVAEVCNGTAGTCPADTLVAGGTECRASAGPCDQAEVCTGTAPACPVDGVRPVGTICAAADGPCDPADTCDGASVTCADTIAAAGTECRAAAGSCDVAEVCNGTAGTCPVDGFVSDGTDCSDGNACTVGETCQAGTCTGGTGPSCDDNNPCTVDSCDSLEPGGCTHTPGNAGTVCRASAGPCDLADVCTGTAPACPVDAVLPVGTVCGAADGPCDPVDTCNGASVTCTDSIAAAGTECRAATGSCDVAEACNGAAPSCPADGYASDGTGCSDGNACTVGEACQAGTCTGGTVPSCDDSNLCTVDSCDPLEPGGCVHTPGNAGTVCRASAGPCDLAEVCTGTGPACPVDGVQPLGTVCAAADGPCDPLDTCDGASVTCTDTIAASGTECRAAAGSCDLAEMCDGAAPSCPADTLVAGGTECRASAGPCDLAEVCTGTAPACPVDGVQPLGTVCAAADGPCDPVDTCNGASVICTDTIAAAGTECRAAAGTCDVAEVCNGTAGTCPANGFVADGTACSDENACTQSDTCQAGVCTGGAPPNCDDGNVCTQDLCSPNPGGCVHVPINTGQTTCGVGACQATLDNCVNGVPQVCTPLPPATANVVVQFDDGPMKYRANTGPALLEDTVLIQIDSPMRYLANSSDPAIGLSWKDASFDDSSWLPPGSTAPYGVGYDTNTAGPNALALIHTTVSTGSLSVYTRAEFTITDVSSVRNLFLGADYDDGYVAYINGVEVARSSNMPAGDPGWNAAPASHESSNGATPNYGTLVDITAAAMPILHNGINILAIGVWNVSATSTELVLVPRLSLGTDWTAEDYNDSSWATGPKYGVGYDTDTAGPNALALIKTAVPAQTYSVYTRASFTIPDAAALAAVTSMFLSTDYDDGYAAWINGVEVFRSPELPAGTLAFNSDAALHESSNGATPNYGALNDISLRGVPALHVGVNVLAIGVWNSNATASTDLLLVPRLSLGEAERCDNLDNNCNGLTDEGFPNTDGDSQADCVDPDDDNDTLGDNADCAALNPDPAASIGPPAEVQNVMWTGPSQLPDLVWTSQGAGVRYDVIGALASQLRPGGVAQAATCLPGGNDLAIAGYPDGRANPPLGASYYYLVRAEKDVCSPSTTGTYGKASDNTVRTPSVDCP